MGGGGGCGVGGGVWVALGRFGGWRAGLGVLSLLRGPRGTIAFLGFTDLAQVGNVENRSLYAISPILWAASTTILVALALRFAPTRAGWALAICLVVFASPRLLLSQLSTFQAAERRAAPVSSRPG